MWPLRTAVIFVLALSSTGISVAPCPNGDHVSARYHGLQKRAVAVAEPHRLEARMNLGAGGSASSGRDAGGGDKRGGTKKANKPRIRNYTPRRVERAAELDDLLKSMRAATVPSQPPTTMTPPFLPLARGPTMHSSTALQMHPASTNHLAPQPYGTLPYGRPSPLPPPPVMENVSRPPKRSSSGGSTKEKPRHTKESKYLRRAREDVYLRNYLTSTRATKALNRYVESSRTSPATVPRPSVPNAYAPQPGSPSVRSPSASSPQPRRTPPSSPAAESTREWSPSDLLDLFGKD